MIFHHKDFVDLIGLVDEQLACHVYVYSNIHLCVGVFDVEFYETELLLRTDHTHLESP